MILHGNNVDVLRGLDVNSVDAVVTDPPYGLSEAPDVAEVLRHWLAGDDYSHGSSGFMGKSWDSLVPGPATWREVLRVLKPGGHALVFCGTRTVDLMGISLRLAGFECRDYIEWVYASGMPKGLNISKGIDKAAGAQREIVGTRTSAFGDAESSETGAPVIEEAKKWDGWNVALKPAHEPILVVRKPLPLHAEPTGASQGSRSATPTERA
jgi:site-specific DNA-methyltransferase (adenine-specific)